MGDPYNMQNIYEQYQQPINSVFEGSQMIFNNEVNIKSWNYHYWKKLPHQTIAKELMQNYKAEKSDLRIQSLCEKDRNLIP